MFSEPLTVFKGTQDLSWMAPFQSSLRALQSQPLPDAAEALAASLQEWEHIETALSTDAHYDLREEYCIQQSGLWEIFAATRRHRMEGAVGRIIYNRACKVLERTPTPARPANLAFREGDHVIRKMLDHLHDVAIFYQSKLPAATKPGDAPPIPPSPGFHRTNVLEAATEPTLANAFWQTFLADNQYVRTILLGDDVAAGATLVDNRLNKPGGGITPGRGLWVKSYSLLRPKISSWLAAALPHDYEQVRCIFISPKGKPVSFLTKTDALDQLNVSAGLLDAADADDLS